MEPGYFKCDYCKAIIFGYSDGECMFCDTPLTEITKHEFDLETIKIRPIIGARCLSSFGEGDVLRNSVVVDIDEQNKTYTVVAEGLGTKMSGIPFKKWRPIITPA